MSSIGDERQLWQVGTFSCVMISCCAGAELQVRAARTGAHRDADHDFDIVLRELYPTKSDLFERSRALESEYIDAVRGAIRRES
jgi:hypothetical protein